MSDFTTKQPAATFSGIPVVSNPWLAGTKYAIKSNGVIHVSPAILELMRHANAYELQELLRSIKLMDLDPQQHDAQWYEDTMQILSARVFGGAR